MSKSTFRLLVLAALAAGCGSQSRDVENYGNSTQAPVLSNSAQHMGGYGRSECLVCHNSALNLHRDKGTVIDADQLNQAVKANGEAQFCMSCHGGNGT